MGGGRHIKRILIIKLGYSETLDKNLSLQTSLGDVLRTTFILHYFKDHCIYWLADKNTRPLLVNNRYIHRIIINSRDGIRQLKALEFDKVINLEKLDKVYRLLKSLKTKKLFGFWGNGFRSPKMASCAGEVLYNISRDIKNRKKNAFFWQDIISQAIGKRWRKEGYVLGYKPKSMVKYDIGFNWTTSNKWKDKKWPRKYWQKLEGLLKGSYSISWQEGFNNLYSYFEWLNSCRIIITADTLGLHLALALKKKVIALFGPTSPKEIYLYNHGVYMLPKSSYSCIPCYMPKCRKSNPCMNYIYPEKVKEVIDREFKRD